MIMEADRGSKQFSVPGEIVITTQLDGTLKFHRYEAMREQIVEQMDQWKAKN